MAVTVEIKGLRELQVALRQLPQKLERRVLNSALGFGGRLIANEAKARAPVDTGNVRRNIRARSARPMDGHTATVIVGVRRLTKRQIARLRARSSRQSSISDPWYWRHLEFGTSKMAPRPFLRPAFEAKKVEAAYTIKDALARRIEKEAEKLRRWAR